MNRGHNANNKGLKDRIQNCWYPGIDYNELMRAVFPFESYPEAWRYASHGGPPGCAMAFNRAIREMGGNRDRTDNTVWLAHESTDRA